VAGGQGGSHIGKLFVIGAIELSQEVHPRRIRLESPKKTSPEQASLISSNGGATVVSDDLASYRRFEGS
jgi:hypothetical protein